MLVEKKIFEEQAIELPFFACLVGDDETTYVKIDEHSFQKIKIKDFGLGVEVLSRNKKTTFIALTYFENKCDIAQWESAVKYVQNYFKQLC